MRFMTGFLFGVAIGYVAGVHYPGILQEKLCPDKDFCQYESMKAPGIEEYLANRGMYESKLEKLSDNYKNDLKSISVK